MKNFLHFGALMAFVSLVCSSCAPLNLKYEVPNCVESKIRQIKRAEVSNPPTSVWEWKVNGKKYYYITSNCCDQYNYLYDENCRQVCAPDGGFTGKGDGQCPEFSDNSEKNLVWEDSRQ